MKEIDIALMQCAYCDKNETETEIKECGYCGDFYCENHKCVCTE